MAIDALDRETRSSWVRSSNFLLNLRLYSVHHFLGRVKHSHDWLLLIIKSLSALHLTVYTVELPQLPNLTPESRIIFQIERDASSRIINDY